MVNASFIGRLLWDPPFFFRFTLKFENYVNSSNANDFPLYIQRFILIRIITKCVRNAWITLRMVSAATAARGAGIAGPKSVKMRRRGTNGTGPGIRAAFRNSITIFRICCQGGVHRGEKMARNRTHAVTFKQKIGVVKKIDPYQLPPHRRR